MSKVKFAKKRFKINSQGYNLRGYILRPEGEGKLPVVIVSHGFASSTLNTNSYAMTFVEEGYVAICYDFCMSGSGISGGPSTNMSVLTEKEDLSNVVDFVKTLDYVDKNRICLAGCSQGGLVTALLAAEREDDIERIFLYYPALCIPNDARRGQMITAKFDPENVPNKFRALFVRLGSKYALDAKELDPYKEICKFKKPVLIVHGKQDKLVNIYYSRRAKMQYPNCKLVEVNGDHGFIKFGFRAGKKATKEYLNSI